jgi:hypothetical protein
METSQLGVDARLYIPMYFRTMSLGNVVTHMPENAVLADTRRRALVRVADKSGTTSFLHEVQLQMLSEKYSTLPE